MTAAVAQARAWPHQGVANDPMLRRFEVKWISGITANESWRLSTTWLRMMSSWVDLSPARVMTATAGTKAIKRVTSRRSQGASRR